MPIFNRTCLDRVNERLQTGKIMSRLMLILSLAAVLLLTLWVTGRRPMPRRSPTAALATARLEPGRVAPAIPLPRYRVVIRAQPAPPKPIVVEGFVRGNTAKTVSRPPTPPTTAPASKAPKLAPTEHVVATATPEPSLKPAHQKPEAITPLLQHSNTPLPTPSSPRANVELGRQLLGADGRREGKVPLISMDYRDTLGWAGYVTEMERLGGRFFLYHAARERILARADLKIGAWISATDAELRGFSPRLRQIEGEPAITLLLTKGRKQFNVPDATLILLLPMEVDFEIVGGLVRALEDRPGGSPPVARVTGNYQRTVRGVQLRVNQVFDAEGNSERCVVVFQVRGRT